MANPSPRCRTRGPCGIRHHAYLPSAPLHPCPPHPSPPLTPLQATSCTCGPACSSSSCRRRRCLRRRGRWWRRSTTRRCVQGGGGSGGVHEGGLGAGKAAPLGTRWRTGCTVSHAIPRIVWRLAGRMLSFAYRGRRSTLVPCLHTAPHFVTLTHAPRRSPPVLPGPAARHACRGAGPGRGGAQRWGRGAGGGGGGGSHGHRGGRGGGGGGGGWRGGGHVPCRRGAGADSGGAGGRGG